MTKKKKTKSTKKNHSLIIQRDNFYKDHPNARALLGIFIVSVSVLVGMLLYKYRIQVEVGKYLWENDGIIYNPNL